MTRRRDLPRALRAALTAPGTKCYRHCEHAAPGRPLPSRLPGRWTVYACPSGVVSVATYVEWTNRDPTLSVLSFLRRRTVPSSLVRPRDLRPATRHGPELGRAAERAVAARRPRRAVRVVYWRVYPFTSADGSERRLFVCRRKSHARPVFFAAPAGARRPECPTCERRTREKQSPTTYADRERARAAPTLPMPTLARRSSTDRDVPLQEERQNYPRVLGGVGDLGDVACVHEVPNEHVTERAG